MDREFESEGHTPITFFFLSACEEKKDESLMGRVSLVRKYESGFKSWTDRARLEFFHDKIYKLVK